MFNFRYINIVSVNSKMYLVNFVNLEIYILCVRAFTTYKGRVCSAGLKNIVPADCCERKIMFWHDVNSDFVSDRTSQPNGLVIYECLHLIREKKDHPNWGMLSVWLVHANLHCYCNAYQTGQKNNSILQSQMDKFILS